MDEDLQHLEAELKALDPRAPSPTLTRRIERHLGEARPVRSLAAMRPWWWWLAGLPAAAALALVWVRLSSPGPVPSAAAAGGAVAGHTTAAGSAASLKPVAAENLLYAAKDEGLVTLADGTPARRERLQYVDTITWRNPRTNASLKWTVPREEVRVVPVTFQ